MKKLSLNQVLQLVLIFALVLNALIHFTSPTYRYYQENFEKVRKGVNEFEQKVKLDFVPAILNLASNRVQVSSSVSSSSLPDRPLLLSGTNTNDRLMSLDFQWYQFGNSFGFELDGKYYQQGDLLFGSVIRSVTPTLVVTDDYQFIKPLIGKFTLSTDMHSNSKASPAPVSSDTNKTLVVPHYPDAYFPQRDVRRGLGLED